MGRQVLAREKFTVPSVKLHYFSPRATLFFISICGVLGG